MEVGHGDGYGRAREEVGGEVDPDGSAVVKSDGGVGDDGCAVGCAGEDGHAGPEEEKWDVAGGVVTDNLGKDGEWRVVDDDAVGRVIGVEVVATGVEGSEDDVVGIEEALVAEVGENGLINVGRCIGVVGGLGIVFF